MNTAITNKDPKNFRRMALRSAGCALAAAFVLGGCSGSDDGGDSGTVSKIVSGALLDTGNAPLSGQTVVYDQGKAGTQTTHTDANGAYRFVLPSSAVTGNDTVTFYDATGHLLTSATVTPGGTAVTTVVTPPAPPSQQI